MVEARIEAHLSRGKMAEAATEALRAYGPQIWRYVCTLVPSEDDARDVFQTFAEDLWRGLPSFRRESSMRSWAYSIAWAAASRHRREAFRRKGQRLATEDYSKLAVSMTTHLGLRDGGRQEALSRIRERLDDEERLLLALRLDRDLSWDEVARIMSRSGTAATAAALRKRFERLKTKIAAEARARGIVDGS
jgi:RNA polymerase sigma-70 factor (ECF subfamily)